MSILIPNQRATTSKRVPWITKDIASLIRNKVLFDHQAVPSNSTHAGAKYKHAVVGALRSAKSDYLLSFSASPKIPKRFWFLYRLGLGKRFEYSNLRSFTAHSKLNFSLRSFAATPTSMFAHAHFCNLNVRLKLWVYPRKVEAELLAVSA